MKSTKQKRVEVRLSMDIVDALDSYCESEFVSRSWVVSKVLFRILPAIPGNSVNMIESLILTGEMPVKHRQSAGTSPADSRPPDPARARVPITSEKKEEKREEKSPLFEKRETKKPAAGFEAFAAELQGILNRHGCRHPLHDPRAQRAVFDRMNPPSPAWADAATEDQIRDFVEAKARELGGTEYSSGLVLTKLLDSRFWERRGTIGAAKRGKATSAQEETKRRAEAERRRREAEERRAAESARRFRARSAGADDGASAAYMRKLARRLDREDQAE